jgi:IclR family transcriptional regulator, KDG regulon repressor
MRALYTPKEQKPIGPPFSGNFSLATVYREHLWQRKDCRMAQGARTMKLRSRRQSRRSYRPVKSLLKALSILDTLGDRPGGLGITDLSTALKAPKSTVHRLIATLEVAGYAVFDPPTARYILGSRLARLGEQLNSQSPLLNFGVATLETLTHQCQEASHLAILEGTEVVYISREESKEPVRISFGMGHRAPAHCTALGKALLAGLTDAEIRMLYQNQGKLQHCTPRTITSLSSLLAEIATIRREGIASDNEEYMPGLRCIAAPVRDYSGRIVAAMSLSMFKHKMTAARKAYFREALLRAGSELSAHLGHATDFRKVQAVH